MSSVTNILRLRRSGLSPPRACPLCHATKGVAIRDELTWWMMPDPGFQNPMPYLAPADARKSYTWVMYHGSWMVDGEVSKTTAHNRVLRVFIQKNIKREKKKRSRMGKGLTATGCGGDGSLKA